MTAVLRIQKINFADKRETDGLVRGVDSGGLIALKKHNERQDINVRYEMKSKQATHIDEEQSHRNLFFKRMTFDAIRQLKSKPHRSNSVASFELVFDFQDLNEEEIEGFDVLQHKNMIDEFLKNQVLGTKYELLSYAYHGDEKNPHFHLVFSGWDKDERAFNFNDVFNPKQKGEPLLDENGTPVFVKHNRGKLKGQFQLDEDGQKIQKFNMVRENGTQKLQDAWGDYLQENGNLYQHKKYFTSILHFPNYVWHRFDETTKQRIYLIREMENERMRALKDENFEAVRELETLLKNEVFAVMNISNDIQTDQAIKRHQKRQKTLKFQPN